MHSLQLLSHTVHYIYFSCTPTCCTGPIATGLCRATADADGDTHDAVHVSTWYNATTITAQKDCMQVHAAGIQAANSEHAFVPTCCSYACCVCGVSPLCRLIVHGVSCTHGAAASKHFFFVVTHHRSEVSASVVSISPLSGVNFDSVVSCWYEPFTC